MLLAVVGSTLSLSLSVCLALSTLPHPLSPNSAVLLIRERGQRAESEIQTEFTF